MNTQRTIRILEPDPNRRGDLFARSMEGLFIALGYEDLRFSVHKSGRELDVEGAHRAEHRILLAECKATDEKIGGGDINKFMGAVDAERRKADRPVSAYFVSLSGFTQTAIEQEKQIDPPRIALFGSDRAISELVKGRIVCPEDQAAACAGQLISVFSPQLRLEAKELLVHEIGWIWCLYFEQGKQRTHFSLVHADGQSLAVPAAYAILEADRSVGGDLGSLEYLAPLTVPTPNQSRDTSRETYFKYLAADFGEIELTGLPADQDVGSRRLRLENIFVPLHVVRLAGGPPAGIAAKAASYFYNEAIPTFKSTDYARLSGHFTLHEQFFWNASPYRDDFLFKRLAEPLGSTFTQPFKDVYITDASLSFDDLEGITTSTVRQRWFDTWHGERRPVGLALSESTRTAILAPPGGGKSTLLRRLATAYAFPERFGSVKDELPQRTLFPIIFRCRQLGHLVRNPIVDIVAEIPKRAEMDDSLATAFQTLVAESFRSGNALVLVDGLDEISDEGARLAFANQLRIFLSVYPQVSLVVTSREAGFRVVSGALSSACVQFKLADFDDEDIKRLTVAWHKEVVGDKAGVAPEALQLAEAIIRTERVRELAKNPLLLTTLLLVKRWVGQLPTRRSVLYEKAIEVLLMTWNVEGHEPLNREEAVPQLAYVAYAMMQHGVQQVTSDTLQTLLTAARQQMPDLLSFAKLSVSEFIDRVEFRSSLLIQSGHAIENGKLCPLYEFRHLTFQEYLTAVAVVEGYYPDHSDSDTVLTALEPHLADERWKEVVPLVAVLAGRRAQPLIQRLIQLAENYSSEVKGKANPIALLGQCVADECTIAPNILSRALEVIASQSLHAEDVIDRLLSSKFKLVLQDVVRLNYTTSKTKLFALANALLQTSTEANRLLSMPLTQRLAEVQQLLAQGDSFEKSLGALIVQRIAYETITTDTKATEEDKDTLMRLGDLLASGTRSEEIYLQFSAAWALVWLANLRVWSPVRDPGTVGRLIELWMASESVAVRYVAAWALSRFRLLSRSNLSLVDPDNRLAEFVKNVVSQPRAQLGEHDLSCAYVVAYYLGKPWSDDDLKARLSEAYSNIPRAMPNMERALATTEST